MSDVEISRVPGLGMIALRADLDEPRLAATLRSVGLAPPAPRRIEIAGDAAAAWMSPDELLLFGPDAETAPRIADLEAALVGMHHLMVDVSDARTVFRLAGPGARLVLAKGAPVDLAPGVFAPGDFRRTRLGQVAAALWVVADDDLRLMCFRSVAEFVGDWLSVSARAAGVAPVLLPAEPRV